MNAKSAVPDIRKYYVAVPAVSGFNYAAAWALRELVGDEIPAPESPIQQTTGFNLEPGQARLNASEEDESPDN